MKKYHRGMYAAILLFCGLTQATSSEGRTITAQQFANRMVLHQAMMRHGFKPFYSEWWHFTLDNDHSPIPTSHSLSKSCSVLTNDLS